MQQQLEKILKAAFAREIHRRIPSFKKLRDSGPELFVLRSAKLCFFIYLCIAEGKDAFTLEVASNKTESYPWTERPGLSRDIELASAKDIWRFRISALRGAIKEEWWRLEPQSDASSIMARIRTRVRSTEDMEQKEVGIETKIRDAVGRICEDAVPFFEASAKQHGDSLAIDVIQP